jgi:hypothetical protein
MNKKDEALKMAVAQLWACAMLMNLDHSDYLYEDVIQALDACKEALEQPSNIVAVPLDKLQDMQRRLSDCEEYLKEDETPAECIARNRKDANTTLKLLAKCMGEKKALEQSEFEKEFARSNKLGLVEQPAQEPVAWMPIETAPKNNKRALYLAKFDMDGKLVELDFDAEWVYEEESWEMSHINYWYWKSNTGIEEPTHWAYQDEPIPLYTHPKQWQGLTDDEIYAIEEKCIRYRDDDVNSLNSFKFARAIEEALKEKNHG